MSGETKPAVVKRRAIWREVELTQRRNPTFIRRLFFDTVMEDFKGDFRAAAAALSPKSLKGRRRAYQHTLTEHVLYRITRDQVMINYGHLEMLARYHHIPTGLILLFTRLQTEVADRAGGGLERARATLTAIEESLSAIRDVLDRKGRTRGPTLVRETLRDAARRYQSELPDRPGRQLRFPIPMTKPRKR